MNILARPYARRIAGLPTEMRFDIETKEFVLSWRVVDDAPGGGLTELFVPRRHYPQPFAIESSAGVDVHVSSEDQTVLLVARDPGEYMVRLRPR